MPKLTIPNPENKKWNQDNSGELFGNLFATWNIDLHVSKGKIRISPRCRINTDSGDDADLGIPIAFVRTSADGTDRWWALCGTVLFKTAGTDPTATFTQDALANTPTALTLVSSDMVEFNGALIVSRSTDLDRLSTTWNANWWTDAGDLNQTALTASIPHPLCVGFNNLLLIGDGEFIHTVDINNNVRYKRLTFGSEYQVIWIRSSEDAYWIGARHETGGEAVVFKWDGSLEVPNKKYGVKSDRIFSGVIKDEIPFIVNGEGQLMEFTGGKFEEVDHFPNFGQINKRLDDGNAIGRSVHRNGMAVIDGRVSILISAFMNNTFADYMENFSSGIWVYDKENGLHHKYSLSQYDGTEIDYGSPTLNLVGALVPTSSDKGLFLAGAEIFTSATATLNVIEYRDTTDAILKRGYIILPLIEASELTNNWQNLFAVFKAFENSTDRIIAKFRKDRDSGLPFNLGANTWTSTTTFTSTDSNWSKAAAGDEVEIIRGRGAGTTVHISSISLAGSTYTVTIDEAITNASGTMQARVQNWTKGLAISDTGIQNEIVPINEESEWVQTKIELRGTGDSPELEKLILTSEPARTTKN